MSVERLSICYILSTASLTSQAPAAAAAPAALELKKCWQR